MLYKVHSENKREEKSENKTCFFKKRTHLKKALRQNIFQRETAIKLLINNANTMSTCFNGYDRPFQSATSPHLLKS